MQVTYTYNWPALCNSMIDYARVVARHCLAVGDNEASSWFVLLGNFWTEALPLNGLWGIDWRQVVEQEQTPIYVLHRLAPLLVAVTPRGHLYHELFSRIPTYLRRHFPHAFAEREAPLLSQPPADPLNAVLYDAISSVVQAAHHRAQTCGCASCWQQAMAVDLWLKESAGD